MVQKDQSGMWNVQKWIHKKFLIRKEKTTSTLIKPTLTDIYFFFDKLRGGFKKNLIYYDDAKGWYVARR